jgi:hypothetical protein
LPVGSTLEKSAAHQNPEAAIKKSGWIEKARGRFEPRADSSDDEHFPVICPTGQVA